MSDLKVGDKVLFKTGARSKRLSQGEIVEISNKISIKIESEQNPRFVWPSAIQKKLQ